MVSGRQITGYVMDEGRSSLGHRRALRLCSVLTVRRDQVLSLCTVFLNCFYGTVAILEILNRNYFYNSGLYHKVHPIMEFYTSESDIVRSMTPRG